MEPAKCQQTPPAHFLCLTEFQSPEAACVYKTAACTPSMRRAIRLLAIDAKIRNQNPDPAASSSGSSRSLLAPTEALPRGTALAARRDPRWVGDSSVPTPTTRLSQTAPATALGDCVFQRDATPGWFGRAGNERTGHTPELHRRGGALGRKLDPGQTRRAGTVRSARTTGLHQRLGGPRGCDATPGPSGSSRLRAHGSQRGTGILRNTPKNGRRDPWANPFVPAESARLTTKERHIRLGGPRSLTRRDPGRHRTHPLYSSWPAGDRAQARRDPAARALTFPVSRQRKEEVIS
ncbi:hypothetical protein NDU88_004868 [Pleurodeles waltl]|uniref:Uncharacterized protein n=1 Tax=Pleurodeles waltl TaxID=8319 RepID=A0AAV7WAZ6_PLEWA|nr:hypothetical protein NDU88_004868 [Pleurodeles waltl]